MAAPCAALRLQSSVASVSTHRTEELSTNVKFTSRRAATQTAAFKGTVRCISSGEQQGECSTYKEKDEGRRRALVSITAVGVAAATWCPTFEQSAEAADLTQRIQRGQYLALLQGKLREAIAENTAVAPALLRLALCDLATYDKATKSGGANGSIRFSEELRRPENVGLEAALALLGGVKEALDVDAKGGPLGWADLIHFGAQAAAKRLFLESAIQKAGGDLKKGTQLAFAFGSSAQWGYFDKSLGRTDASEADAGGRVPVWGEASTEELIAKFAVLGQKPRQLAVLSAFLGPDQSLTEAKLAGDPAIAPFVRKYQVSRESVSQTDYEVDLITTFTKLALLGPPINYEAYTYVPLRPKLRF